MLVSWVQMLVIVLATLAILLLTRKKNLRWIYVMLRTLPRDIRLTLTLLKIHRIANKCVKNKITLFNQFSSLVRLHPHKVALYFDEQVWTFSKLDAYSNKITRYFKSQGFEHGDTVALLLHNTPEYPCIVIGLSRLGIVTALINTNLQKNALLYSSTLSKSKAVVFGTDHWNEIKELQENLQDTKLYHLFKNPKETDDLLSTDLSQKLRDVSDRPIEEQLPNVSHEDPVVYIYTSGTTGLPKASIMTHTRFVLMASGMSATVGINKHDIVYSPLPLYHVGGGISGVGQAIVNGTTTVIRKKFSASNYFKDCVKYNVTVGQYIGEMCRYVLTACDQEEPEKHKVRVMYGNGINPLVWKVFVEKFGIKHFVELYGSTEGPGALINLDNTIGSVGYIPWFIQKLNLISLVKCNESGEPIRNSTGNCIKCDVNEPGLLVSVMNPAHAVFNFKGYTDTMATDQKILQNVLVQGDVYYNSGDILVYDEFGYFYFKDRTGDTFRWKGENVSTTEVEITISNLINLKEVIVYGVQIPYTEGRAGMAAIVDPNEEIDIEMLEQTLKLHLPGYSIPMFIRILETPPMTSTFKLKKFELREEGYNVNIVKDKLYFLHPKQNCYVTFSKQLYEDILNNKLRL